MSETSPAERVVLAIDVSDLARAYRLASMVQRAGGRIIKAGLELQTASSWADCAEMADTYGLEWIADAKIDDIPNTTEKAVRNIMAKVRPPIGITVHAKSGLESLARAQQAVDPAHTIFGVTELTSLTNAETFERYGMSRRQLVERLAGQVALSGARGIVVSPHEIQSVKSNPGLAHLTTLVPGIRSQGAASHDQANTMTPAEAFTQGADLLVVGRQITQVMSPEHAYEQLLAELA